MYGPWGVCNVLNFLLLSPLNGGGTKFTGGTKFAGGNTTVGMGPSTPLGTSRSFSESITWKSARVGFCNAGLFIAGSIGFGSEIIFAGLSASLGSNDLLKSFSLLIN